VKPVFELVASAFAAIRRPGVPATARAAGAWSAQLLKQLEWRRLEELCAAYFQMEGYEARVARTGADGVVDIHLCAAASAQASILVQCKAWDAYPAGVEPVRRLRVAMSASRIAEGMLVSSGRFMPEAAEYARRNSISLVDAGALLKRLNALAPEKSHALLEFATQGDYLTPTCPACSIKMVSRKSTRQGRKFWGCRNYPQCKQTLPSVG
jgi:restriction system protein